MNTVNSVITELLHNAPFNTTCTETTVGGYPGWVVTLTAGGQTVADFFPTLLFSWPIFEVNGMIANALVNKLS